VGRQEKHTPEKEKEEIWGHEAANTEKRRGRFSQGSNPAEMLEKKRFIRVGGGEGNWGDRGEREVLKPLRRAQQKNAVTERSNCSCLARIIYKDGGKNTLGRKGLKGGEGRTSHAEGEKTKQNRYFPGRRGASRGEEKSHLGRDSLRKRGKKGKNYKNRSREREKTAKRNPKNRRCLGLKDTTRKRGKVLFAEGLQKERKRGR